MEIKDRIAAFEAKDFAKAFEGFNIISKNDIAKRQNPDPEEDLEEYIQCYLEEDSGFIFYQNGDPDKCGNDFAESISILLAEKDSISIYIEPNDYELACIFSLPR